MASKKPSWIVDGKRFATKIKSASQACSSEIPNWKNNPTRACPECNHIIDNNDVIEEWPGLPKGVKFDPSDQETIWHLLAKVGTENIKSHPFIDEFIPTVDENNGICYTHPRNLPGVQQDGSVSHFFHRAIKAYNTGTRKRRKIHTNEQGDIRWHKTGRTKPVFLDGIQKGCKKIMVLYISTTKGGKAEKTNWVMHQYHLGMGEDEKDGQFVISKVFFQTSAKPGEVVEQDLPLIVSEPSVFNADSITPEPVLPEQDLSFATSKPRVPKVDPITPKLVIPEQPRCTEKLSTDANFRLKDTANLSSEVSDKIDKIINFQEVNLESPNDYDIHPREVSDLDMMDGHEDMEVKEWWDDESQYILNSQQLVEGLHLCDELLQSQSSNVDANGEEGISKPRLSDYSHIGAEHLKKDLEDCQNLRQLEVSNLGDGRKIKLSQLDFINKGVDDYKQDSEECNSSIPFEPSTLLDTPPDFRLSQLEFGSQDSFLAWGGTKITD